MIVISLLRVGVKPQIYIITTTACCYCNFSLHLKQRPHGGVRIRWRQVDGGMEGQLHVDVQMLST